MENLLVVLTSLLVACGEESPGGSSSTKVDPTSREAASAEKGALAVKNRQCQGCHGDDMSGSTSPLAVSNASAGIMLYAPNLTGSEQGIKGWTDDALATAIRTGYDRDGLQLCPQMRHDASMTDYEVFSIVLYLRSLPAKDTVVPASKCPPIK